jgi:glucose/mannose transport system substrate-binding protein
MMGDWAKGEFTVAKLKVNQGFYCTPLPGTGTGHLFNSDAFIFFRVKGQQTAAQMALAEVLMRKEAQEAFNLIKGSVPVRLDADMTKFDECGKQSHADFVAAASRGTLVASPEHFQPTGRWNAWRDVALAFWSDDHMTPQQAADKMAAGAKL